MDAVPTILAIVWEMLTRRHRVEVEHGHGILPSGVPIVFVRARNACRTTVWAQAAAVAYTNGTTVRIPMLPTRLERDGPWETLPAAGRPAAAFDLGSPAVA